MLKSFNDQSLCIKLFSFRQLINRNIFTFRVKSHCLSHHIKDHTIRVWRTRRIVHIHPFIKDTSTSMFYGNFPHLCRHTRAKNIPKPWRIKIEQNQEVFHCVHSFKAQALVECSIFPYLFQSPYFISKGWWMVFLVQLSTMIPDNEGF
uniref:Uncharacterized protein n=1 Tax=Opuntia streptacantha TaxID=393608 RepID=A0A7C9A1V4_OPUST